jgi:hypothetical protein
MKTKMHFVDYDINLQENGDITLDDGLTLDQLGLVEGQVLKVKTINNKVTFSKIEWAQLTIKEDGY